MEVQGVVSGVEDRESVMVMEMVVEMVVVMVVGPSRMLLRWRWGTPRSHS